MSLFEKKQGASRESKAEKIIKILQEYKQDDLNRMTCLDVGCSMGLISDKLSAFFGCVIGVDVDATALLQAKNKAKQGLSFSVASGDKLPFTDQSFDVVVCAQVYEHVNNQSGLFQEIYRVLKVNGVCFFSGPNQLAVIEEHYWLPFLSWLPHKLSDFYIRIFKRGTRYDAYPRTYWQILRLVKPFKVIDYTFKMIRQPELYNVLYQVDRYPWLRHTPGWMVNFLLPFFPNYNWILVKEIK